MPRNRLIRRRRRILLLLLLINLRLPIREMWVHPMNIERFDKGEFYTLYPDLRHWPNRFYQTFRMSVPQFDNLLEMLSGRLRRRISHFRDTITPEQQLVLTIGYLASGDSLHGLATRYRLGTSTVSVIIRETCDAIWDILQPLYMRPPTRDDWIRIEQKFSTRWNYPNCCGALDGKHVAIQNQGNSGSLWYNYKGHFSTVLLALVDAEYRFIYVDIGQYGSNSDTNIFKHSLFGQAFINQQLDLPDPKALPNFPEGGVLPHCIVGDEAFPLRCDLMRPYARAHRLHQLPHEERIFNYRLSRARRIVENAFGILAQRWRIYNRRINLRPENVDRVVKATCVLHNYLCERMALPDMFNQLNPDNDPYLRDDGALLDLDPMGYHSDAQSRRMRNIYKSYFNRGQGNVAWQERAITHI